MSCGTIDISLTSISTRMNTLCATLQSLLDQDYKDLCIHLYLSREPYLLDAGVPVLPKDLKDLQRKESERLKITYCSNTGPYRKLLPYLHNYWGESRLVVTADDDTIYPSYWLSSLVNNYIRQGCSIAYRGHRIVVTKNGFRPYRSWMKSIVEENPSVLILPTGKDGVLYDTAFFPIEVLNVVEAMRLAPTTDDLWFRWHLARNNIRVFLINSDYTTSFAESDYSDSLYLNYNRGGKNDQSIAALDKYFKSNFDYSMALKSSSNSRT